MQNRKVPFWEHDLEKGLKMLERAVETHIITSHYAAPLLVNRKQGIIYLKVVSSHHRGETHCWRDMTSIIGGDKVYAKIARLKHKPGKDIVVLGAGYSGRTCLSTAWLTNCM